MERRKLPDGWIGTKHPDNDVTVEDLSTIGTIFTVYLQERQLNLFSKTDSIVEILCDCEIVEAPEVRDGVMIARCIVREPVELSAVDLGVQANPITGSFKQVRARLLK